MVEYPRNVVWFLECREWSRTPDNKASGPAPIEAQMGSAVVVELQQVDKKEPPRKYLLTCAHVVRGTANTGKDPERKKGWGPLLGEIQCFEPGKGYSPTIENNRRSGDVVGFSLATIHLSPFRKQEGDVPDEARLNSNDWVLLDVTDPDFQAMPAVLKWGAAENEREPRIIGFPGGASKWKRNQLVQSVETDPFRLNRTPEAGMLKLDGIQSKPGMSGGGIFDSEGLFVGIHRYSDDIAMERGGISAEHIRQRLMVQGWRPVESVTAYAEKEDPFEATDLGGALFINRKPLRDALREIISDKGETRVVAVKGLSRSGKSHSIYYIDYIETSFAKFEKAIVELGKNEAPASFFPCHLIQSVLSQIGMLTRLTSRRKRQG